LLGTESDAAGLLDELVARVGADPTSEFRELMPYRETKRYLAELGDAMAGDDGRFGETSQSEPSPQVYTFSKSEFFRKLLPAEIVTALA
jgi:hypothetical protein